EGAGGYLNGHGGHTAIDRGVADVPRVAVEHGQRTQPEGRRRHADDDCDSRPPGDYEDLMRWLVVVLVGLLVGQVLMAAPLIGMTSSPWSPWWFMGATASPPGVVPLVAVESP